MNRKDRRAQEREARLLAQAQRTRPKLVAESDHGPLISLDGLSAMCGVPVSEIKAEIERQKERGDHEFRTPAHWIEAGRRRAEAYRAVSGGDCDLERAIAFYARSAS